VRDGGGFIGALRGRGVKENERNRGDPTMIAPGTASCLLWSLGRDDRWVCLVSGRSREARVPFQEGGEDGLWAIFGCGPNFVPKALFSFSFLFTFSFLTLFETFLKINSYLIQTNFVICTKFRFVIINIQGKV
jgi:hypothetical protein